MSAVLILFIHGVFIIKDIYNFTIYTSKGNVHSYLFINLVIWIAYSVPFLYLYLFMDVKIDLLPCGKDRYRHRLFENRILERIFWILREKNRVREKIT